MSTAFIPPFSQASSDARLVGVLEQAYAKACRMLHDKGQPTLVQEVIAARIVEIVKAGEHDPGRITERVMAGLGLRHE